MNLPHRYLAIEGPIGVGKTTLARLLADKLDARLVLEAAEENPFLQKFYKDSNRYGFQTQIFFLLSRYDQQRELLQGDLFEERVICDYLFARDRIFAYLNLDDDELALYEQFYRFLGGMVAKPDLVIYLQASTTTLQERIRRRGREYELDISDEYLMEVNRSYNAFFFHYDATPLLIVNTDGIDFVHYEDDLVELIEEIQHMHSGKRYYVPVLKGAEMFGVQ